jgi:hypothetical protein
MQCLSRLPFARRCLVGIAGLLAMPAAKGQQSEPPVLNPFGSRAELEDQRRDDAVPGYPFTREYSPTPVPSNGRKPTRSAWPLLSD